MMINLDCAKNLLDMWVLMLQNQWKKNEKKSLSQFWENHNFVNFPSIEAKQFMEQPKQSSFHLGQFISYVTELFPGWITKPCLECGFSFPYNSRWHRSENWLLWRCIRPNWLIGCWRTLGLFKCIVSDLFFYNNQKSATSVFVILPLQF